MNRGNFFLVLIIFFVPCMLQSQETPQKAPVTTVGVSLPLTEAFAEYGAAIQNGINLAREDNPGLDSRVEFLYEDDSYQPKKALAGIENLRARLGVLPPVFFVWGNEPALGVAPVVDQYKLLTFAVAQHPSVTRDHPWVTGFINSARDLQEPLAHYIREKGYTRVALVKTQASYFDILRGELQAGLEGAVQIELVSEPLLTDLDFRTLIAGLRKHPPEILGLYLSTPQLLSFAKQAREFHFKLPLFLPTQAESAALRKTSREFLEGGVFTQLHVEPSFASRFVSRYGTDNHIGYAANAYDFAVLMGKLAPDISFEKLRGLEGYKGVCGEMHVQSDPVEGRRVKFQVALKQIRDGRIEEITVK